MSLKEWCERLLDTHRVNYERRVIRDTLIELLPALDTANREILQEVVDLL
jgi:hypothetical protein